MFPKAGRSVLKDCRVISIVMLPGCLPVCLSVCLKGKGRGKNRQANRVVPSGYDLILEMILISLSTIFSAS
ncbi:hypothetical protein F4804DRAFT_64874 [Jackrogersella minutella]|nr:hypothetical protein F4804DRAFT_64874 [Jackrogersella minutella]